MPYFKFSQATQEPRSGDEFEPASPSGESTNGSARGFSPRGSDENPSIATCARSPVKRKLIDPALNGPAQSAGLRRVKARKFFDDEIFPATPQQISPTDCRRRQPKKRGRPDVQYPDGSWGDSFELEDSRDSEVLESVEFAEADEYPNFGYSTKVFPSPTIEDSCPRALFWQIRNEDRVEVPVFDIRTPRTGIIFSENILRPFALDIVRKEVTQEAAFYDLPQPLEFYPWKPSGSFFHFEPGEYDHVWDEWNERFEKPVEDPDDLPLADPRSRVTSDITKSKYSPFTFTQRGSCHIKPDITF